MVLYRRNFFQGVSLSPKNRPFGVQKVGKKAFLEFMAKNPKNLASKYYKRVDQAEHFSEIVPK